MHPLLIDPRRPAPYSFQKVVALMQICLENWEKIKTSENAEGIIERVFGNEV
jgi:hypothetical protein